MFILLKCIVLPKRNHGYANHVETISAHFAIFLLKKKASIYCDLCYKWIHLKCSGLKRLQLQPPTNRSKSSILFRQTETLDNTCSVCNKKVRQHTKGISCLGCNHIIHKKCSKLSGIDLKEIHSNMRYWECIPCKNNKFPFSSVEDNEVTKYSFNSDYKRKCGHKKVNYNSNDSY